MAALLQITNLHATVDGKPILNGLDLAIAPGEVHAVMGPNGSGKSTLAHVLAGREGYDVTQGQVLFQGRDLLAMAAEERARALSLSQALFFARARAAGGEQDASALIEAARSRLDVDKVDYLDLVDARTLEPIPTLDRAAVLAVAAFVGRTRLIDNVPIGISEASANPAARTARPTPVVSIKTIKVT